MQTYIIQDGPSCHCGYRTEVLRVGRSNRGRRRWILSVPVNGAVWMDSGAITAIAQRRKSLFAAGIVKVVGAFSVHDAISVCDAGGHEIGRALANYSHVDVAKVKVKPVPEACPAGTSGLDWTWYVFHAGRQAGGVQV